MRVYEFLIQYITVARKAVSTLLPAPSTAGQDDSLSAFGIALQIIKKPVL